jgi:hypothetical protein
MWDKQTEKLMRNMKGRSRPRSTYFEDEINKQDRRSNRRHNDKKLIEDELDEEDYDDL